MSKQHKKKTKHTTKQTKIPRDNQLTTAVNYDTSRMVFGDPMDGNIGDIGYKRIPISTLNPDGTLGDLLLETPRDLFSFGVSENTDPLDKAKITGYSLPLCIFDKDSPTTEQKEWVKGFKEIIEEAKKHTVNVREKIEQYELEMSDLKKFCSVLYYKKEKGKIVKGAPPTLYPKLIVKKEKDADGNLTGEMTVRSMFFDEKDNPLEALDLKGKFGKVDAVVKVESVFIGSHIRLQVKLYEATYRVLESSMKPMMRRGPAKNRLIKGGATNLNGINVDDSDDEDEVKEDSFVKVKDDDELSDGSIIDSDEELEPPKKEKPKKKKKVKRK